MKLQLELFTATSKIRDKIHCCYWDFCMGNKTGMVLDVKFVNNSIINSLGYVNVT